MRLDCLSLALERLYSLCNNFRFDNEDDLGALYTDLLGSIMIASQYGSASDQSIRV